MALPTARLSHTLANHSQLQDPPHGRARRRGTGFRHPEQLAARARRPVAVGGASLDRGRGAGDAVAQVRRLPRPGLPRRRRLHGPRQLGDVARRRLEVRLRAALHRPAVEHHGDRPAASVRPHGGRDRARPRAGLPRRLSARGVLPALAPGRGRDLRHRPRRGDRHRDRAQPAVRHPARDRRAHHRRSTCS